MKTLPGGTRFPTMSKDTSETEIPSDTDKKTGKRMPGGQLFPSKVQGPRGRKKKQPFITNDSIPKPQPFVPKFNGSETAATEVKKKVLPDPQIKVIQPLTVANNAKTENTGEMKPQSDPKVQTVNPTVSITKVQKVNPSTVKPPLVLESGKQLKIIQPRSQPGRPVGISSVLNQPLLMPKLSPGQTGGPITIKRIIVKSPARAGNNIGATTPVQLLSTPGKKNEAVTVKCIVKSPDGSKVTTHVLPMDGKFPLNSGLAKIAPKLSSGSANLVPKPSSSSGIKNINILDANGKPVQTIQNNQPPKNQTFSVIGADGKPIMNGDQPMKIVLSKCVIAGGSQPQKLLISKQMAGNLKSVVGTVPIAPKTSVQDILTGKHTSVASNIISSANKPLVRVALTPGKNTMVTQNKSIQQPRQQPYKTVVSRNLFSVPLVDTSTSDDSDMEEYNLSAPRKYTRKKYIPLNPNPPKALDPLPIADYSLSALQADKTPSASEAEEGESPGKSGREQMGCGEEREDVNGEIVQESQSFSRVTLSTGQNQSLQSLETDSVLSSHETDGSTQLSANVDVQVKHIASSQIVNEMEASSSIQDAQISDIAQPAKVPGNFQAKLKEFKENGGFNIAIQNGALQDSQSLEEPPQVSTNIGDMIYYNTVLNRMIPGGVEDHESEETILNSNPLEGVEKPSNDFTTEIEKSGSQGLKVPQIRGQKDVNSDMPELKQGMILTDTSTKTPCFVLPQGKITRDILVKHTPGKARYIMPASPAQTQPSHGSIIVRSPGRSPRRPVTNTTPTRLASQPSSQTIDTVSGFYKFLETLIAFVLVED